MLLGTYITAKFVTLLSILLFVIFSTGEIRPMEDRVSFIEMLQQGQ